jgi:hypothetical protein
MKLHHFLPHASTIAIVLSSALAGAAVLYAMTRDRLASGDVGGKVRGLFGRGAGAAGRQDAVHSVALAPRSTGNSSFDDYRAQTLRKLEEEAAEFRAYLDNLRSANDRAEFEAFLKARNEKAADNPAT